MAKLTSSSQRRAILLYLAFVCVVLPATYKLHVLLEIVAFVELKDDPQYASFWARWPLYVAWYQTNPWSLVIVLLLFIACGFCWLCVAYILIYPVVYFVWHRLQKYCPFKIRRRTWCFCNCSCKSLEKILRGIHDSHCKWEPQRPDSLDPRTRRYVTSILQGCKERFNEENMYFRLVGSSAEGLGKPYTVELENGYADPCCKFLLRLFCCCCPCSTAYTSLRTDFDVIMESGTLNFNTTQRFTIEHINCADNFPGFAQLKLNPEVQESGLQSLCSKIDDEVYLSSVKVRSAVYDIVNTSPEIEIPESRSFGIIKHPPLVELEEKGPAVKLVTYPLGQTWYWNEDQRVVAFDGDIVFGIHCSAWPQCAARWACRPRLWPAHSDVQEVLQNGFILVPKSSDTSGPPRDGVEWKFSFPHSEVYLLTKIPRVAKACYLALKLILKNHLIYHCEELKTYYLKTTLLWELEKHTQEFWCLENIVECFDCLLDSFIQCIHQKRCLNYWIESVNLFANIETRKLSSMTDILNKIKKNASPYIDDVGSMWC